MKWGWLRVGDGYVERNGYRRDGDGEAMQGGELCCLRCLGELGLRCCKKMSLEDNIGDAQSHASL